MSQTADCTCECPDGENQHLCGCRVYDTPHMANLREEYSDAADDLNTRLKQLSQGEISPNRNESFANLLRADMRRLMICAAKIAIEDKANPSGAHNDEPWQ